MGVCKSRFTDSHFKKRGRYLSYLIKDTTKAERKKLVENALGISLLGAGAPTEETKLLIDLYINGEIELQEVKKRIINKYQSEAVE